MITILKRAPLGISVLVVILCSGARARADVGLMLDGPTGLSISAITGAGHSSVYLSRVCPDTPVRLRMCAPGEQGSVISNYNDFTENANYEWNIVPLSVYLYGVEEMENKPLIATVALRRALWERERTTRLREVCGASGCKEGAHWRDQIGEALVREVYIFQARTTQQQDEAFVAKFNARGNVNHFNGFYRNCADFARTVINTYYPGAARADWLNDFGMTSPKAISRSFTHHGVKHPEMGFHVVRYAQVPGEFRHSYDARHGTEVAFRSIRWSLPMLLRSHELVYFAAAYTLTGRFNPYHELRRRPAENTVDLMEERKEASRNGDKERAQGLAVELKQQRNALLGTDEDWQSLGRRYAELLQAAETEHIISAEKDIEHFMHDTAGKAQVYLDSQGAPWLEFADAEGLHRLGLTERTLGPASGAVERSIAVKISLARMVAVLHERKKYREAWPLAQEEGQIAAFLLGQENPDRVAAAGMHGGTAPARRQADRAQEPDRR